MPRSPRGDLEQPRAVTEDDLQAIIDQISRMNEHVNDRLDLMNETMPAAMALALTQAIQTTLRDPNFWDVALDQLGQAVGRRSVKTAGSITLGLFKRATTTFFGWVIIAALVYNLGGWQLLTSFFKSWFAIKGG